ncbi:MAG: DUF4388 domain-containing protein [Ktedonobacteraceae bacterium]|nr:DUF4388 domain-containing protein [Ktedonobacteraceae bacterium]MBV9020774.1 DUF4388 domain-containing protein [Ktedonobacteraceae bacterium]
MSVTTAMSGSLKDFSLIEVLQVVELGGMTGAIHLKQPETGHVGILYFNEGKLANCSELVPGALTLGNVLQQLAMTTHQHIEDAFKQQLHDAFGKRIGERLVAMRVISEKQLMEALRTKALWTARELALWQDASYQFIASPRIEKLLPHGDPCLDIEVVPVTMEMVCYSDEWEELRTYLPQGMRTALQLSLFIPQSTHFDVRSIELITRVNLYRRVRGIATGLRRPELDVARDLAKLIQQQFVCLVQETPAHQNGHGHYNRSPHLDPTERLHLENFELFNLLERMEVEWDKHRTPMEQLPALLRFVNWTMEALGEACRKNETELDPNTLQTLLIDEGVSHLGNYEFRVEHNRIDVESFTTLCNEVFGGDIQKSSVFYDEASRVLQQMLSRIFELINARIASPHERLENQEVWEAMFEQFALRR